VTAPAPEGETSARQALPWLAAIDTVASDPVQLVRLLLAADDRDDAVRRVAEHFGLTPEQADVVLDQQFAVLVGNRRGALAEELRVLRAEWGPPLELDLRIRHRRSAALVVDGTEHRFRAGGLQGLLDRVACFLRDEVARPALRPVVVTTGLTGDWPRVLRIWPGRTVEYEYADDPA
jgi:hypothetical protein